MDLQDEIKRRVRRRRLLAARRYRSRRLWRTISRRRRTGGMFALLLLVLAFAAAFWFTRPQRVQQLAQAYLTELTGGRGVRIASAHFSPFEGIRLRKVRVLPPTDVAHGYLPDEKDAIFRADELLLDLSPGSLLAGKLKVRRIVALRPELVRVEEDGGPSYLRGGMPADLGLEQLPLIELREGHYRQMARIADGRLWQTLDIPVNLTLWPDPDREAVYRFDGEVGQTATPLITGLRGTLQLQPLAIRLDAPFVLDSDQQLPRWISDQLQHYKIDVRTVEVGEVKFDFQSGVSSVTLDCRNSRLSLRPHGWENLDLTRVRGKIRVRKRILLAGPPADSGRAGTTETGRPAAASQPEADEDGVTFDKITGLIGNQEFALSGGYRGFEADAPFDITLVGKEVELPQDEKLLAQLPRMGRQIWDEWRPSGKVRVEVLVARAARGAPVRFNTVIECLDASVAYHLFPYRVERVTGRITADNDAVHLSRLVGRRGSAEVTCEEGWVRIGGNWPMRVVVRGRGLPVDEALLKAMAVEHPAHVEVVGELNVTGGSADFDLLVTQEDAKGSGIKTQLTIRPRQLAMKYSRFPYPIRVVDGRIEVVDGGLNLTDFQILPGSAADSDRAALILMDGHVRRLPEGGDEVVLKPVCQSLPLDESLWQALNDDSRRTLDRYHISGRATMVGSIVKRPGRDVTFDLRGDLSGGRLNCDDFPYPLEQISGEVRVTPDRVELTRIKGRHGRSEITGGGTIVLGDSAKTELIVRSDRLALDDDLYQALPPAFQARWKQFEPSGWIGLDMRLRPESPETVNPGSAASATTQPSPSTQPQRRGLAGMAAVLTITALGNSIRWADFPLPLEHVTGQVVIRPDRVELMDVQNEQDGRRIRLSGTIWPDRDNQRLPPGQSPLPMLELKLSAEGLAFDETLRKSLPWRLRQKWNDALPSGRFDLGLDYLRYTPLGEASRWDFGGRLELRNVRAIFGVTLEGLTGQIAGKGTLVSGQPLAFVGKAEFAEATVASWPATAVKADLLNDTRTGVLRIDNLVGKTHGGQVNGFVHAGLDQPDLPYAVSLAARGVDFAGLLNAHRSADDPLDVSGSLEGQITIEGQAGLNRRRGQGEIQIGRARVYRLPTVLELFEASKNVARSASASQNATIVFHFDRDELTLDQAILRDPAFALMGTGRVDLAGKRLDMTFVTGQPSVHASGGLRAMEELFSGAGKELMEYRVTGAWDKPEVQPVTLHSLRDAFTALTAARKRYQPARREAARAAAPNQ